MTDFGDTRQGDLAGSPADPDEVEMDLWWGLLGDIGQELVRLETGLAEMRRERERLEAAGMYPAIPSESWEDRSGGETRYLRMVFPVGTAVRRKEYIGCRPEAIAEARRLAANRRQWEELTAAATHLERFLVVTGASLRQTADRLASYELPELGTVGAGQVAGGVPKEEDE